MKPPSGIMYRPPELAPAPELVLEPPPPELPPLQAPAWHVAPTAVQSSQAAPAVPQYVSPEFWQVPFVSQQPLQAWVPHVPVPPDPLLLYVPLEVPPSLPSPGLVVEPPQAPMAAREVTKMPAKMRVETLMIMSSPPKQPATVVRPRLTVPQCPQGVPTRLQVAGVRSGGPFLGSSVEPELVRGVGGSDTRIRAHAAQVVRIADLAGPAVHHAQAAYAAVAHGVTE
jgi:hypothetical protein